MIAPTARVHLLVEAYQVAAHESIQAARVLDELVVHYEALSKALAMAPKALLIQSTEIRDVNPEDFMFRLSYLDRPKGAHSIHRDQIDIEAIIRAYLDETDI